MELSTKSLPHDKLLHFWYGTLLSVFPFLFIGLWGLIIPFIVGAYKEIVYDKIQKKGTPDKWDFFFTVLPAIFIYIIYVKITNL